jgi:ABC-type cobalamin/Fe3+-siderophores transport system ATPase subunit
MSKSSKWNIWDFHLHTPYSILNNGFGSPEDSETWNHYLEQVETKTQERGIVALGITDYFTIEGYKKVLELQQQGELRNVFIFPNIEFRVDKIIYRTKNSSEARRLNLHVLLSPDIPSDEIEEGFLHDLDFVYENDAFGSPETRKLKIANLILHGEKLQTQHPKFAEESALKIGCTTAVVQVDQIKKNLDSRFKGRYLLVLADEDLSEMSWDGQDHAVRKQLVQMSHAIFSSNQRTREFCLGNKHSSLKAFIEEFKSLKPCLWGCDAHSFTERFLEPNESRYCWIKGTPSWEGLKQVLYEPFERVRIQPKSPEPDKSSFTIKSLEIESTKLGDTLSIDELSIELNPNLVTIIGGRGSGKTALLDLIASSFREGAKLQGLETSFVCRLYGDKRNRNRNKVQPIRTVTTFESGEAFEYKVGAEALEPFDKADILYLTQNHFEEYSANSSKLSSHIIDLVFENLGEERAKYEEQEQKIRDLEIEIQSINLQMQQMGNEIAHKEEPTEKKLRLKQGEEEDFSQRIVTIEGRQEDSEDEGSGLTEKISKFKQSKIEVEGTFSALNYFLLEIERFNNSYASTTKTLNESLSVFGDFCSEIELLPIQLEELQRANNAIIQNTSVLEMFSETLDDKISTAKEEVSRLAGTSKVLANLRQKLANLKAEIEETEQEKAKLTIKKNQIGELEEKRLSLYSDIIYKTANQRTFLQQMIDRFEDGKDEILGNLSFVASVDTSKKNEYFQNLAEKIDNRAHTITEIIDNFTETFSVLEESANESDKTIEDFSIITKMLYENIEKFKVKGSTTKSDYYNTAFKPFFNVGVNISFNSKSLDSLSMGERAIVLLKILLALDDKPLLIDQPEEHLDNRYIFDELVPAFRSAKKKRQIIIATHNANLAVNTDAEQIIIAEPDGGVLRYKHGTIEDLAIREKITQILEGGESAFKKREEKYGYKF